MFPILATIDEGWTAATGFVRAYPRQSLIALAVYFAAAGVGVSKVIQLPLPMWLGGLALTWGLGAATTLALAPVWAAIYRFAVLGDRARRFWEFDRRTWRVVTVMMIMAIINLVGAIPFALGLDVLPVLGVRRLFVVIVVGIAFVVKFLAFWLTARLAIAPAMAAAGTRAQAMDTSWDYTRWTALRILAMLLLVYLPMLCISASFVVLAFVFKLAPESTEATVLIAINVVLTTTASVATDVVWAAITGRLALRLVKAHRKRTAEMSKDQLSPGAES